jgi:type I restriction enzyme, S subunit
MNKMLNATINFDFIETELGPLPKDWNLVTLGKYIDLQTGKRMKGGAREKVGILSIGGEHITKSGNISINIPKYITEEFYNSLNQGKVITQDLLMVKDGATTGKLAFIEKLPLPKLAVNEHVFIIRSKDTDTILNKYLYYMLLSRLGQSQIQKKFHGLIGGVNRNDVKSLIIPLPPLSEQRAIAHVLSTVRQAIEATEGVIAAARELKRSMMKHLFTYGPVPVDQADQVPLKETECWEVPEHWDVTEFGNVATLQRGKDLPKRKRIPGDYPIIGSNGIVGYHNKFVTEGKGVFVGRSGSVGKVKRINSAYWPLNTALWVKDFHGNDRDFIYYLLSNFDFRKYASGVSVPTLNRNLVHPVKIGVPTIGIQIRIAKILNSIDQKINTEEIKKKSIENLFNGLLHNLMTGKVRVKT